MHDWRYNCDEGMYSVKRMASTFESMGGWWFVELYVINAKRGYLFYIEWNQMGVGGSVILCAVENLEFYLNWFDGSFSLCVCIDSFEYLYV